MRVGTDWAEVALWEAGKGTAGLPCDARNSEALRVGKGAPFLRPTRCACAQATSAWLSPLQTSAAGVKERTCSQSRSCWFFLMCGYCTPETAFVRMAVSHMAPVDQHQGSIILAVFPCPSDIAF